MTALGNAFEAAVRAHVGARVPTREREPTWADVFEEFDSNEEIATAAGYGRPGQHPRGSPAWRRRRTFMRNLQRYRQGVTGGPGQRRTPRLLEGRLISIVRSRRRRREAPLNVRQVIRLMGRLGTTTWLVVARFRYSSPKNPDRGVRTIEVAVYTDPEVYEEVGWPMEGRDPRSERGWDALARMYLEGWAIAYGLPDELLADGLDSPQFEFSIGRGEGVQYDYTA